MGNFHSTLKVISRSSGRSSVAAAAYRSGERLTDERTGRVHDFTRRRTPISTEILTPDGAPAWTRDRGQLWNRVEAAERRWDAQTAREIEVSIPRELSPAAGRDLVRRYVRSQFVARGMIADVAYHGEGTEQPHAHIMLTMRPLAGDDFAKTKDRSWNDRRRAQEWRKAWADEVNHTLEAEGRPERVDHRSLAKQRAEALDRGDVPAAIRLDRPAQMKRGPRATHAPEASTRAAVYAGAEANRLQQIALAERDARSFEEREIRVDATEAASPHDNYAALKRIRGHLATLATAAPVPDLHQPTIDAVQLEPVVPRLDMTLTPPPSPDLHQPTIDAVQLEPVVPRLDMTLTPPPSPDLYPPDVIVQPEPERRFEEVVAPVQDQAADVEDLAPVQDQAAAAAKDAAAQELAEALAARERAEAAAAAQARAMELERRFLDASRDALEYDTDEAAARIAKRQPAGLPWPKVEDELLARQATDDLYRQRDVGGETLDVGDLRTELEWKTLDNATKYRSRQPSAPPTALGAAISEAAQAIRDAVDQIITRILDEVLPDRDRVSDPAPATAQEETVATTPQPQQPAAPPAEPAPAAPVVRGVDDAAVTDEKAWTPGGASQPSQAPIDHEHKR